MSWSLIQPLATIPVVCLDVETTGAGSRYDDRPDRIVEIGIVRYENAQPVAVYDQLIDPLRPIDPRATRVTGITDAMCQGKPTFIQQLPDMLPILKGAIIVGHNVRFDLAFLIDEFARCTLDLRHATNDPPVIDTLKIARRRFGRGGNSLGKLARRLGYEPPIEHRALPDAQTTAIILHRLLEPFAGWQTDLADTILAQGGPMKIIEGIRVVPVDE